MGQPPLLENHHEIINSLVTLAKEVATIHLSRDGVRYLLGHSLRALPLSTDDARRNGLRSRLRQRDEALAARGNTLHFLGITSDRDFIQRRGHAIELSRYVVKSLP